MELNPKEKVAQPPFDSLTLMAVTSELEIHLIGGQIQDVRQPASTEIQLGIRSHGKNYLLHLSANPRFARVHLTETRLPNPPSPATFCMSLRKYVENGVIRFIRQINFDRILELGIERIDDNGESRGYILIAELMGKHSNLVLVNEAGTVLEAAHRINSKINRFRETLPGQPYVRPPSQLDKTDPFALETAAELLKTFALEDSEMLKKNLLSSFRGMSPFLANEIVFRVFNSHEMSDHPSRLQSLMHVWQAIFKSAENGIFHPIVIHSESELPEGAYPYHTAQFPDRLQKQAVSLNFALDDIYKRRLSSSNVQALLGELHSQLNRQLHRLTRSVESQQKSVEEAKRAEYHRQSGEMILANLWQINSEDAQLVVQDYFHADLIERTIELDIELSPQENADVYFKRYRKAKERGEIAAQMLEAAIGEKRSVETGLEELISLESAQVVSEIQIRDLALRLRHSGSLGEVVQTGSGRAAADASPFEGHKIRRMRVEGFEVLVGETATANDYLTTRVSSANDIWMHVRSATSAHVVIRTQGAPALVPHSVLLGAAKICARHSGQKHSSLITVDYTLRKFVRKPRGAKPGSVEYQREKSLEISLEA